MQTLVFLWRNYDLIHWLNDFVNAEIRVKIMQYVFLDLTRIGDLIINTKRTYIFHVNNISELYRASLTHYVLCYSNISFGRILWQILICTA